MIRKWLVKRTEFDRLEARLGAIEGEITPAASIRRLDERIAAIEGDIAPSQAIQGLGERLSAIEDDTAPALAIRRLDERLAAIEGDIVPSQVIHGLGERLAAIEDDTAPALAIRRLDERLAAIEGDLVSRQAIRRLDSRIATIERDLPALLAMATGLRADLRRHEQQTIQTVLAVTQGGRRIEAMRRLVRWAGVRLDRLASETERSEQVEVAKVKASLAILEHRIEREAEQARRSATGLFERIEELRRNAASDGDRLADEHRRSDAPVRPVTP